MSSSDGKRSASGQDGQGSDEAAEDEESSSSSSSSSTSLIKVERSKSSRGPSAVRELASDAVDLEDDGPSKLSSSEASEKSAGVSKTADAETERKARELFLQGVEFEQDGKLFDAILKYKKAVHLVPDIEKRAFDFTTSNRPSLSPEKQVAMADAKIGDNVNANVEEDGEMDVEVDSSMDMVTRLARLSINSGIICIPAVPQKGLHISCLPFEIICVILKWVVSADLDLRSLERCSEVCRGFYIAARSNEIWKPVCLRTWGLERAPADLKVPKMPGDITSWRQFYLTRPRVRLHGCYIARMSYLRQGERGFQDNEFYRSWHVVQYYRLIRFFAGGKLAMVTTAEEPPNAVKALNSRYSSSLQGVMFGTYRTDGDRVICKVRKSPEKVFNSNVSRFRRRRPSAYVFEVPEQDFVFELELSGRRYQRLLWKTYKVYSRYLSGAGAEQCSDLDVNNSNMFPVLHFSPVKSYIAETNSSVA